MANNRLWICWHVTALNSKPLVGPVNKTYNQSTHQYSIEIPTNSFISTVGAITVVGKITYISNTKAYASFHVHNRFITCYCQWGWNLHYIIYHIIEYLHYVTISGNVIYPDLDTINGSKYTTDILLLVSRHQILINILYYQLSTIYDVRTIATRSDGEVVPEITTLVFDDMDKQSKITYTVNITVVNINGQTSNSTVTKKTA